MKNSAMNLLFAMVVSLSLLFVAPTSFAATFYVAPNGSNGNPGTSTKPWATPGYGASHLSPGDTLIIKSGIYVLSDYENDILRPPSGTPSSMTTIKGETGSRPVLAGKNNLAAAIDLGGKSHIRIENIEITHDSAAIGNATHFRDGILIVGSPESHDLVLDNLYIHHIDEYGIDAQDVDGLRLLNSQIEFCGFGSFGGPTGNAGGLKNIVIRHCSLSWSGHYYQGGDGSNRPYDRPDGFGIEPSQGPILIENTKAAHNFGDGLDSKARNTLIRRCVVANNSCDGIKLWGGGSTIENSLIYGRGDGTPDITPWAPIVIDATNEDGAIFKLLNVTVDDQLGGNYLMYVQYDNPINATLIMRNCIFSGRGPNCPIWVRDTVTLNARHNLFWFPQRQDSSILEYGTAHYDANSISTLGAGNIYGNPLFNLPAWGDEGDYHLQITSPAIDSGEAIPEIMMDLDGNPRPLGKGYDIGAYEMN